MHDFAQRLLTENATTYQEKACLREGQLAECLRIIMDRQSMAVKRTALLAHVLSSGSILAAAALGFIANSDKGFPYLLVMIIPMDMNPWFGTLTHVVQSQARVAAFAEIWQRQQAESTRSSDATSA